MVPDTPSRRLAAVLSLLVAPPLGLLFTALSPPFPADTGERLAGFADGPLPTISAVAFLLMQLPMLVVFLTLGRLVLPGAPRLSAWGTALGVLGCFGHVVFGGLSLGYLVMAHDPAHREVYAGLLTDIEGSPVMLFAVVGLLGTVLGQLLVAIALFRTRTGPVWVGPALGGFLVLEFGVSNVSAYASYLAVLLLTAAFWALAATVRERSHVDRGVESVGEPLGGVGQPA